MDTVIVEIFLPAVNQQHDFILPAHVPIGSFLPYLLETVKASANVLVDDENACLCDMETRKPLPLNQTLSQCGVHDGSRLMLL